MNYIQRIYDLLVEEKYAMTPGMAKHARKGKGSAEQVRKQMGRKGSAPVIHPAVAAGSSQERAGIPGSSPLNKGGKPSSRITSRKSY